MATGLAAPQTGISKRVAVINCDNQLIELINPEILHMTGEQMGMEGCLSFIGYFRMVKRNKYIKVITMDRYGNKYSIEGKDLLAICVQHETDYLNGILYIDHIVDNILYNEITNQKVNLQFAIDLTKVK